MEIDITNQNLHLLHEIIEEETLPRLSVKSLLRFKCVSKRWLSLIESKRFIKKQYQNSTKDPSLAHHRAFLLSPPPMVVRNGARVISGPSKVAQCPLLSLRDEALPVFHALEEANLPTTIHPSLVSSISIVGSCNGLVCISLGTRVESQQFVVWNPCTGLFKAIHHTSRHITSYGFYWDEASDDYRVISNERWNSPSWKIYSLRKNSCKEIRVTISPAMVVYRVRGGMSARGRLHWLSREPSSYIVTFDLKSETFETMETPPNYHGSYAWSALGLIGECLSVHRWWDGRPIEVWVMKEYAVKESWGMLYFVQEFPRFSSDVGRFCMGREGEEILLIKIGISIKIYDRRKGKFVNSKAFSESAADVYVESLVSPLDEKSMSSTLSSSLSRLFSLFSRVVLGK